jgi:hypothetical protein
MFENYRRYKRFLVSARALIAIKDKSRRLTTQVNTISQGGMGFYSSTSLEIATPVSVELLMPASGEGISRSKMAFFDGRIASICPQGDNYYIGIAFDSEIGYDSFLDIVS